MVTHHPILSIPTAVLLLFSSSIAEAADCASLYGQCGGSYWTGPTCCATGSCVTQNDYYYQCVSAAETNKETAATTSNNIAIAYTSTTGVSNYEVSKETTSTTNIAVSVAYTSTTGVSDYEVSEKMTSGTSTLSATYTSIASVSDSEVSKETASVSSTFSVAYTSVAVADVSTTSVSNSTGFVGVSGQTFTLDSSTFSVVGANSYWVGLGGYGTTDMTTALSDMVNAGATVFRTWGFNEVTSASGIYYQLWDGETATVNTGDDGLEHFDTLISLAKSAGIKIIVTLTNNWSDYGGMDVYVKQLTGTTYHDYFYTNDEVKQAFKSYVKTFVSRYVDESTIMAWELANEPRCTGTSSTNSGTCNTTAITDWATEMSEYIKSIDTNHLVAIGDEGFFNNATSSDYPYTGGEGIDFDENLKIDSIDFGTFHLYPTSWGESSAESWGETWITKHAESQKSANKPVIIEEYGVTSDKTTVYTTWLQAVIDSGLSGELYWQAGSTLSSGKTSDDGYAIYPDSTEYTLVETYAAKIISRDSS